MSSQYYEYWRSDMLPFVPETAKRCLEVGCGAGRFGQQLIEKRGATVVGIEPVTTAYEIAKTRLSDCYNILFDETNLPDGVKNGQFDCIIFNDVLEHLVEPWEALALCKKLLAPGGCVVASIPNILYFHEFFKMFRSQNWEYTDGGIFDRTHLRFFTRKSIQNMFESSGYSLKTLQGIHPSPSKKIWLWNLLTLGRYTDMKFMQFAVQAFPK